MSKYLDKFITQKTATKLSWIRFEENTKRDWGLLGQDWGVHDLNMSTGGVIGRKITTIASLPSMGKTALINAIMDGFERWENVGQSVKPELAVCSWEMEASELIDRRVSSKTGLSSRDLMMGAKLLSQSDIGKVKAAIDSLSEENILYQQESLSIDSLTGLYFEFVGRCNDLTKEDGIPRQPVFIIDYVGLASFSDGGVRTQGINEFYYKLKQAANKTNGHFIILAQLDKSTRKKDYPSIDDLAESQSIERNSDNVILLHRPEHIDIPVAIHPRTQEAYDSKGKMIIRVQKCRLFGISDHIISCDMSRNRFWSMNHDPGYKYWELYSDIEFWKSHFKVN